MNNYEDCEKKIIEQDNNTKGNPYSFFHKVNKKVKF